MLRRLITFADACEALGIARQTGYNWASCNRFPVPVIKRGQRSMVSSEALDRHLELLSRPAAPPQPPSPAREKKKKRGGRPRNAA